MSGGGERRVTVSCVSCHEVVAEVSGGGVSSSGEGRVTVSCCVMRSRVKEAEAVCRVVERDVSLCRVMS